MEIIYNFDGSVSSDLGSVKVFLASLLKNLNMYIKDEDLFYDIRLILNELIVNSVIHGNKENINKKVYLNIVLSDSGIKINVRDEGEGIDYDFSSYKVEEMRCSGRGLILVEALADDLILKRNEITAVKYL